MLHLYITLSCSKVVSDRTMEAQGETEVQFHSFFSSALNINGQLHTPTAFSLVKVFPAHIEYIPKSSSNTSKKNLLLRAGNRAKFFCRPVSILVTIVTELCRLGFT